MEVSVIGLGTFAMGGWSWGGIEIRDAVSAIKNSMENGINLIDTAPIYGKGLSEEIIGKSIKGLRDKVILATKCGLVFDINKGEYFFQYENLGKVYKYLGPESIKKELEDSLKRLGTDYIDLYQTHWQDSTTEIEVTMDALMKLKSQGKIRAIGVSNVSIEQLKKYNSAGEIVSDQEMYSMLDREAEKEILPWCENTKITFLAYSPLARGLLTGKMHKNYKFKNNDSRSSDSRFTKENIEKVNNFLKEIDPILKNYNINFGQAAISWTLSKYNNVIALCGARNKDQAINNLQAGDIIFNKDDVEKIDKVIGKYNIL